MPQQVLNNIQQIFDTFSFGILIEDSNRRILYTNKRFMQIFGIPEQIDLKGTSCLDSAQAAAAFFKNSDRFLQDIQSIPSEKKTHEEVVETSDSRFFRRKYNPVFENQELIAHIWNYEEVTELTLKEYELEKERNFFHTILNEIPADIAIFSPDHRYLFLNRTAIKDEALRTWIIGKNDYEYCSFRGIDTAIAEQRCSLFAQAKQLKAPVSWIDEVHKKGESDITYILRVFYPYLSANGELELMIGYGINITEQKSKEEEIKLQRNRFLRFIETLTEGVIQISANGSILFYNERLLQLLHIRTDEITNPFTTSILRNIAPSDIRKILRSFVHLRQDGKTKTGICRIIDNGETGYIEYTFWRTESTPSEDAYFAKLQDITSQVLHEQNMRTVIDKEKELSNLKSHFIHITSHELRTPLSVILSSAEILDMINQRSEGSERMKPTAFTASIIREVKRITTILNELLMIGRIENGKIKFEPGHTDLVAIIQEISREQFAPYRDGRTVEVRVPAEPVICYADVTLIKHAIANLLDNAFKYSTGAPAPEISISREANAVKICVSDQGIGIPEEEREQLFHSFFRASNVGNISGTGLGLMVVEHVASLHNAKINIESKPNHGTRFELSFPLEKL